jgi:phosphatidylserine decarboxylase
MTIRKTLTALWLHEDINFLLTNRIPRRLTTKLMGWFSKIEIPAVSGPALWLWRQFADLHLEEAEKSKFFSIHDCFTRTLKPGMRPVDPDPAIVVSPCDAIVGTCGRLQDIWAIQAKDFRYSLYDLLGDPHLVREYRDATYVTLRITSSMYHRFHAPYDCRVREVRYFSGDTWNVNPIALKRVRNLFCRNERAMIRAELPGHFGDLLMVPIAAILVAGIRLQFAEILLHMRYDGPALIPCDTSLRKGEEMGWFEHGSTILLFAPKDFTLHDGIVSGKVVRTGEALMRLPECDRHIT